MDDSCSPRLNSYRPLCLTRFGEAVVRRHNLKPFIDGSIRREPDFENPFPSITGLCRLNKFAPTLHIGTSIAYITVKGSYGLPEAHWRLVAILEVIEQFLAIDSHDTAYKWYSGRGLPVPRNCLAFENPGADFDTSTQRMDVPRSKRTGAAEWDAEYRDRGRVAPAFNITKVKRLELQNPPILLPDDMRRIFGRIPGTQNPPFISQEQLEQLVLEFDRQS
jgi:hypothetical protein